MNCAKCGLPIDTAYTSDEGCLKHRRCYWIDHPYVPKTTLAQVLSNNDDQVTARALVSKYIGAKTGRIIVNEFNRLMAETYKRRIE
jgi:hypothetical protein